MWRRPCSAERAWSYLVSAGNGPRARFPDLEAEFLPTQKMVPQSTVVVRTKPTTTGDEAVGSDASQRQFHCAIGGRVRMAIRCEFPICSNTVGGQR